MTRYRTLIGTKKYFSENELEIFRKRQREEGGEQKGIEWMSG
jgi:hypothetical protein